MGAPPAPKQAPSRSESQRDPQRASHREQRGLSIRLHSREGSGRRVMQRFLRRTSYPEEEGPASQGLTPPSALLVSHRNWALKEISANERLLGSEKATYGAVVALTERD